MKKIAFLSLFIIYSACTYGQWIFDVIIPNDSIHSPVMQKICVIDSTTSWALGFINVSQNSQSPFFARKNSSGWRYLQSDLNPGIRAYCFTATDSLNVWLGSYHPDNIYYSSNGGLNWILQYHVADTGFVKGISFCKQNKQTGYAFCDLTINGGWNGFCILKTSNGGLNWTKWNFFNYGYACSDYSISVIDSNNVWFGVDDLLSDNAKIIRTTNGGLNWIINDIVAGENAPYSIQFSDDKQTGIFAGQTYPTTWFYRTTNAGQNWNIVYSANNFYTKTIKWVAGTSMIYGNSENDLVRSIDNGVSWSTMSGIPGSELRSIDAVMINPQTVYALALLYNRRVYKLLDTAGISGLNDPPADLPEKYKLKQNYPNPFNPETKIVFDLPKAVNVNIKIFDLSGKEIITLINNEFKYAGRYELIWNAGNYASGVYIYRVEAGEFVSTKKMVLIK